MFCFKSICLKTPTDLNPHRSHPQHRTCEYSSHDPLVLGRGSVVHHPEPTKAERSSLPATVSFYEKPLSFVTVFRGPAGVKHLRPCELLSQEAPIT